MVKEKEKCCFCLPIECGVKALATFCILATIMCGASFWIAKDFFNLWWPIILLYGAMSGLWIYTFVRSTEESRKATFFGFCVLIWFGVAVYETYIFASGQMNDYLCSEENVATIN